MILILSVKRIMYAYLEDTPMVKITPSFYLSRLKVFTWGLSVL